MAHGSGFANEANEAKAFFHVGAPPFGHVAYCINAVLTGADVFGSLDESLLGIYIVSYLTGNG